MIPMTTWQIKTPTSRFKMITKEYEFGLPSLRGALVRAEILPRVRIKKATPDLLTEQNVEKKASGAVSKFSRDETQVRGSGNTKSVSAFAPLQLVTTAGKMALPKPASRRQPERTQYPDRCLCPACAAALQGPEKACALARVNCLGARHYH